MRRVMMVMVLVGLFVGSGYAEDYSKSFVKAKEKYEKKVKEIEKKAQEAKSKEIEKVIKEYKKEIKKCSKAGKVDAANELNDEMKELLAQKNLNVKELKEMLVKNEWKYYWGRKNRTMTFDKNGKVVEGKHDNENQYKINENGCLGLYTKSGKLFNAFKYNSESKTWVQLEIKGTVDVNMDKKLTMDED